MLLHKDNKFFTFSYNLCLFVNNFIFFLFNNNDLHCMLFYKFTKLLIQSLPLYTSCLFSKLSNNGTVGIKKLDEICSPTFVVDGFSGLL